MVIPEGGSSLSGRKEGVDCEVQSAPSEGVPD
jgi:hypothetical protein